MHQEEANPRGLSGKRNEAMENDLWPKVQLSSEPVGDPAVHSFKGVLAKKVNGWLCSDCGFASFSSGC